ncbi:hypothetical protein [Pseudomonas sp. F3-2]|uniref:hypothetical protein n=1 Tax=Pseudomonas sp. F3-2 TaxID=3141539 RepID=UPI00315D05FA
MKWAMGSFLILVLFYEGCFWAMAAFMVSDWALSGSFSVFAGTRVRGGRIGHSDACPPAYRLLVLFAHQLNELHQWPRILKRTQSAYDPSLLEVVIGNNGMQWKKV